MPRLTAKTVDRHVLYQQSVQAVDAEIDFVDDTYKALRGRRASRLREDFCGTANTSCEWVRRRPGNIAVGLDLDQPTLDWGLAHNIARLKPSARERVQLLRRDVLRPGPGTSNMDVILAMNFSYWCFKSRATMLRYFRSVRASLAPKGLFMLDFCGGWECMKEMRERRPVGGKVRGFTYIWDHARYDPISGDLTCHIHFAFPDGTRIKRAFSYDWRLWTFPELRDILTDAGFSRVTMYWEGDDGDGEGNGVFEPADKGEAIASWIAYIVAEP
jgi:SAM-dependent methyltransferase